MADSKAQPGRGPASANGRRSAVAPATARAARTTSAVSATPTSRSARARREEPLDDADLTVLEPDEEPEDAVRTGPPLWLQIVSFVLAIVGLAISIYETWAHFNGSHLLGCSTKAGGTFDCTAVITSPQSMVFGVIPVAVLGLLFYVAAVPMFSPWAWRLHWRLLDQFRLISMIVGMGFVMYLIYAEIYQIQQVCEYCTGVHIVTFLLFCVTVFSAAIWGFGTRGRPSLRWPTRRGGQPPADGR